MCFGLQNEEDYRLAKKRPVLLALLHGLTDRVFRRSRLSFQTFQFCREGCRFFQQRLRLV